MTTMQSAANLHGNVEVEEATSESGRALFDARCKELLGVPGAEFLAAFESDAYPADWSDRAIVELEMLVPYTR